MEALGFRDGAKRKSVSFCRAKRCASPERRCLPCSTWPTAFSGAAGNWQSIQGA